MASTIACGEREWDFETTPVRRSTWYNSPGVIQYTIPLPLVREPPPVSTLIPQWSHSISFRGSQSNDSAFGAVVPFVMISRPAHFHRGRPAPGPSRCRHIVRATLGWESSRLGRGRGRTARAHLPEGERCSPLSLVSLIDSWHGVTPSAARLVTAPHPRRGPQDFMIMKTVTYDLLALDAPVAEWNEPAKALG